MNKILDQIGAILMLLSLIGAGYFLSQADISQEGVASQYVLLFVGFVMLSLALNAFVKALKDALS